MHLMIKPKVRTLIITNFGVYVYDLATAALVRSIKYKLYFPNTDFGKESKVIVCYKSDTEYGSIISILIKDTVIILEPWLLSLLNIFTVSEAGADNQFTCIALG